MAIGGIIQPGGPQVGDRWCKLLTINLSGFKVLELVNSIMKMPS